MKTVIFFILVLNLIAQEDYSVRMGYGKASSNNLGDIIIGNFGSYPYDLSVVNVDAGYLLTSNENATIYLRGGVSKYNESAVSSPNTYEANIYVKGYWNLDFLDNRIRFGLGEGASYTSRILYVEKKEAESLEDGNGNTSYFLNYLDVSIDLDLGRLVQYGPMHNTYIGWVLKHRSGIFGLINGVTKGGSNYNTIYIEKNF